VTTNASTDGRVTAASSRKQFPIDLHIGAEGIGIMTSMLQLGKAEGWLDTFGHGKRTKYLEEKLPDWFNEEHQGFLSEYKPITPRVLMEKIKKAENYAKQHYFSPGVHALDETGALNESSFPLWVTLWGEYFDASNSRAPKNATERQRRDKRRSTYQSMIGTQPPLIGDHLRTEVTRSSYPSHLSIRGIGDGTEYSSSTSAAAVGDNVAATIDSQATAHAATITSTSTRRKSRSPVPVYNRQGSNIGDSGADGFQQMIGNLLQVIQQPPIQQQPTRSVSTQIEDYMRASTLLENARRTNDENGIRIATLLLRTVEHDIQQSAPANSSDQSVSHLE
jgi:hypothetical protein